MKKLLIITIMILFISVSVIPSSANLTHNFDANLKTGIGVILLIENTGNETIDNMDWGLSVKGGYLGLINKTKINNISQIKPGRKITKRVIVFGYGYVNIGFAVTMPPQKPGQPYSAIWGKDRMFIIGPVTYLQKPFICIK